MLRGDPVQIEFTSADATTAAAVSLRHAGGAAISALAANERLIISSISASLAAAVLHAEIFNDTDADGNVDAGELLVALSLGPNHWNIGSPDFGTACRLATIPKVKAAVAGAIQIAGVGYLVKG
jgi:hypothetical protein